MDFFYIDDCRKETAGISLLGGFIIDQVEYRKLINNFVKLKENFGLRGDAPVKWSPPNNPQYAEQNALEDKNKFRYAVLNLIAKSDLKIVVSVINEKAAGKGNKYDRKLRQFYTERSLEFLAQRFQMELATSRRVGQIVLDSPGSKQEAAIVRHYRNIRINGSNYPSFQLPLKNLMETIYYSHCFACEGLQLADTIVSSFGHAIDKNQFQYVDTIKNVIRENNGQIKGVGIVVYPSNDLVADSLIKNCSRAN